MRNSSAADTRTCHLATRIFRHPSESALSSPLSICQDAVPRQAADSSQERSACSGKRTQKCPLPTHTRRFGYAARRTKLQKPPAQTTTCLHTPNAITHVFSSQRRSSRSTDTRGVYHVSSVAMMKISVSEARRWGGRMNGGESRDGREEAKFRAYVSLSCLELPSCQSKFQKPN